MATSQVPPSSPWHFTELDDRIFQIRGRTFFFVAVLFAVIILVTFIFLYARWVFRFHRLTAFSAAVHGGLPVTSPPPHQGLDPTEINCLPITLYKAAAESEDDPTAAAAAAAAAECCICLGVFEDGEKVKILPPCRHCYHSECVDRWLRSQSSCPLCRVTLRVNTSKNLQMV